MNKFFKIILVGSFGGFISEGIMGVLFISPFIKSILYNPNIQSQLFINITSQRDLVVSIIGIILLSIIHAWLYVIFVPSIPGKTWVRKGLFWGFTIWLMFWVFQEWFVYHTLLGEPIILNLLELFILLFGSLVEGLIISYFFKNFNI